MPDISANVTSYGSGRPKHQLGPVAKSARTVAQELGVLGHVPCLLVICHHFSNDVFVKPLVDGTADETLHCFDEFCSAFYDTNVELLRDIEQLEDYLDSRVCAVDDLLNAERIVSENAKSLSEHTSSTHELVRHVMNKKFVRECLNKRTFLPDRASERFFPRSKWHRPSTSIDVFGIYRLIQDIDALNRILSEGPGNRVSSNDLMELIVSRDAKLLCLLQDASLPTAFSFDSSIHAMSLDPGINQQGLKRLESYVKKKEWLDCVSWTIHLDPADIGPFLSVVRLVDSAVAPIMESTRAIRDKAAGILDDVIACLSSARAVYSKTIEAEVINFIHEYGEFAKRLGRAVIERLPVPQATTGYVACNPSETDLVLTTTNALTRLLARVSIPSVVSRQLIAIQDLSRRRSIEEILREVETEEASPLLSQVIPTTPSGPVDPTNQIRFDVFLAHNTKDKRSVRAIAAELKRRQVAAWLDDEQIAPGQWFQEALQRALSDSRALAVIIGPEGIGSWQALEVRVMMTACVEAHKPVIPILLPGVDRIPDELPFLKELHWVQFQKNVHEQDVLSRIVWGIRAGRHNPATEAELIEQTSWRRKYRQRWIRQS